MLPGAGTHVLARDQLLRRRSRRGPICRDRGCEREQRNQAHRRSIHSHEAEFLFETRMASQSDEAALLALMADSAARVAEATRANTALVEQHELAAATFSSRATAEISRLQGEARR